MNHSNTRPEHLAYEDARKWYTRSGITCTGRPAEGPKGTQPRADLHSSDLIAVEVPSPPLHGYAAQVCSAWEAIAPIANSAPAFDLNDNTGTAVILLATPSGWVGRRRVVLDAALQGLERFRAADDQSNPALPCVGSPERWIRLCSAPAAPAELLTIAATPDRAQDTDITVQEWLERHFERTDGIGGMLTRLKGERVEGLSPADVHAELLRVTGWTTSEYPTTRLSRVVELAGFTRHRTGTGYKWLVRRRPGVELGSIAGVAVASIDPLLLELAREVHAIRELHPDRKREKAEAAAAAARAAEQRAKIIARFGSQETLEMLRDSGYMAAHQGFEAGRFKAGSLYGETFTELRLGDVSGFFSGPAKHAEAAWWIDPPDTAPQERYRRIVMRVIEGRNIDTAGREVAA